MSRCIRRAVALTGILIAGAMPSASLRAQSVREAPSTTSALQPGDTVRIWALMPTLNGSVGIITALDRDNLALEDLRRRGPQYGSVIAVPSLTRIDVQRGRYRSGSAGILGTALGVAGGALAGGLAGIAFGCGSACGSEDSGAVGTYEIGLFAGAVVGGVIGSLRGFRARPRWHRLTP